MVPSCTLLSAPFPSDMRVCCSQCVCVLRIYVLVVICQRFQCIDVGVWWGRLRFRLATACSIQSIVLLQLWELRRDGGGRGRITSRSPSPGSGGSPPPPPPPPPAQPPPPARPLTCIGARDSLEVRAAASDVPLWSAGGGGGGGGGGGRLRPESPPPSPTPPESTFAGRDLSSPPLPRSSVSSLPEKPTPPDKPRLEKTQSAPAYDVGRREESFERVLRELPRRPAIEEEGDSGEAEDSDSDSTRARTRTPTRTVSAWGGRRVFSAGSRALAVTIHVCVVGCMAGCWLAASCMCCRLIGSMSRCWLGCWRLALLGCCAVRSSLFWGRAGLSVRCVLNGVLPLRRWKEHYIE